MFSRGDRCDKVSTRPNEPLKVRRCYIIHICKGFVTERVKENCSCLLNRRGCTVVRWHKKWRKKRIRVSWSLYVHRTTVETKIWQNFMFVSFFTSCLSFFLPLRQLWLRRKNTLVNVQILFLEFTVNGPFLASSSVYKESNKNKSPW